MDRFCSFAGLKVHIPEGLFQSLRLRVETEFQTLQGTNVAIMHPEHDITCHVTAGLWPYYTAYNCFISETIH